MKDYLHLLREGQQLSKLDQLLMIIQLSTPAILAQISSIVMEYIDASMVGHLGKNASASIGLVSSTTWLLGGLCMAICTGFTVQIAQSIGAKQDEKARLLVKEDYLISLIISLCFMVLGLLLAPYLPYWLQGQDLASDASAYFRIFSISLPIFTLNRASSGMLQGSGNMKVPSISHIIMCFLDVIFNAFMIFDRFTIGPFTFAGMNLGVKGAAIGTLLAELTISLFLVIYVLFISKELSLRKNESFILNKNHITTAFNISLPIAGESALLSGAQVISTRIVSPLGTTAIAAHSLSITAESLCYMPGYGIGNAATTLIGQSIGAKREDLTRHLGYFITLVGMITMTFSGILLYLFAGDMLAILTPVKEIQVLGTQVLRIEAFAEPMFGASIVANGVFRGKGDTLVPSIFNFATMWCIRLPLAFILSLSYGLQGVWIAMCIELCVRGLLFLLRLRKL